MSKMTDAEIVRDDANYWRQRAAYNVGYSKGKYSQRAANLERIAKRLEQLDEEADRRRIVAAANTLPT